LVYPYSNISKAVMTVDSDLPIHDLLKLKPSAFKGLKEEFDAFFAGLHVHNIEELGHWKWYKICKSIVTLKEIEKGEAPHHARKGSDHGKEEHHAKSHDEEGQALHHHLNIAGAVKKHYENLSLHDLCKAPITALRGFPAWAVDRLKEQRPHVITIQDLGTWKYCVWAEAMFELSKFEKEIDADYEPDQE
jgi:hypothetical protein